MTFISTNLNSSNVKLLSLRLKLNGYWKIHAFKFHTNEQIIDQYLKKNYNIGLRQACSLLLSKANIITNNVDTIYSIINGNTYDKLAKLITYGNGEFFGSNILKAVLTI